MRSKPAANHAYLFNRHPLLYLLLYFQGMGSVSGEVCELKELDRLASGVTVAALGTDALV